MHDLTHGVPCRGTRPCILTILALILCPPAGLALAFIGGIEDGSVIR